MNPINTEIGKLLSGKEAAFNYEQLNKIVQDELAQTRAKLRTGLARADYDSAHRKIGSLQAAQLVLKSVQLYQSE